MVGRKSQANSELVVRPLHLLLKTTPTSQLEPL